LKGEFVLNVNVVIGIPGAGKSTYIQKKFPNQEVVDMLTFQNNGKNAFLDIIDSQYLFYAAVEKAVRQEDISELICEGTLLTQNRRMQVYQAIKTGCDKIEKINLYCIIPNKADYLLRNSNEEIYDMYVDVFEFPVSTEPFDNIFIINGSEQIFNIKVEEGV
jgi:hypothetical protein